MGRRHITDGFYDDRLQALALTRVRLRAVPLRLLQSAYPLAVLTAPTR